MKLTYLFFFLFFATTLCAQSPIEFINPSFEDEPRASKVPRGWKNCGPETESPPDVHPSDLFMVTQKAKEGKTYLGMVARDNKTWEAVGQKLKTPLLAGSTYAFGIHLALSENFLSYSRLYGEKANYNTGCALVVWGGNDSCDRQELLYESQQVNNFDWQLYNIVFTPKENYEYLVFDIYYADSTYAYNGNLLLDNIITDVAQLELDETALAYSISKTKLDDVEINPTRPDNTNIIVSTPDLTQSPEYHKSKGSKRSGLSKYPSTTYSKTKYSKGALKKTKKKILKNDLTKTIIQKILSEPLDEKDLAEFPSLQNEIVAVKNILAMTDFLEKNSEKQCFNKRSVEKVALLANDFKHFECKQTEASIEKLIPIIKSMENKSSIKDINTFKQTNNMITRSLIEDDFYNKIGTYIEKNKDELKLLYKI